MNSFSPSLFKEQKIYVAALRRWACAFESFLDQSTSRASCVEGARLSVNSGEEVKQYVVIWISYLIIYIALSTCLDPDESSYDTFQPLFKRMVEQAQFIPKACVDKTSADRKSFSFEMNIM